MRDALLTKWPAWSALPAPRAWFVPGRVELLGKHTDYLGGRSLLCCLDRGITLLAAPRADGRIRMRDERLASGLEFPAGEFPPSPRWARFPALVARRLRQDFPGTAIGADILFASTLPPSAGMSSSSALVVASFLGMAGATDIPGRLGAKLQWARYLAGVESGVGTHGGSEDHTAILCCRAGHWSQVQFSPLAPEAEIAAPEDLTLVIAASGVVADKSGGAQADYNRLADSSRHDVLRREQFRAETEEIIPAAVVAAQHRDWLEFGRQVARSQSLAETHLGNQVPETIALARLARQCRAVAASSFGAGFGGAVWALAPAPAGQFLAAWRDGYCRAFPHRAAESLFFPTLAGPPAHELLPG